jgi:hypothetical protein
MEFLVNLKSKQKTIRISTEHPIQKRILELTESGKPVRFKDGRYAIGTDFLRELLVIGYQQVADSEISPEVIQKSKIQESKKLENLDSMTEPI